MLCPNCGQMLWAENEHGFGYCGVCEEHWDLNQCYDDDTFGMYPNSPKAEDNYQEGEFE